MFLHREEKSLVSGTSDFVFLIVVETAVRQAALAQLSSKPEKNLDAIVFHWVVDSMNNIYT